MAKAAFRPLPERPAEPPRFGRDRWRFKVRFDWLASFERPANIGKQM